MPEVLVVLTLPAATAVMAVAFVVTIGVTTEPASVGDERVPVLTES